MGKVSKLTKNTTTITKSEKASAAPGSTTDTGKTEKKHKKICKYDNFQVYIFRVLKQVHPEIGVSKRTMAIMNSFIKDILDKVCTEAACLSKQNKTKTISSKDI